MYVLGIHPWILCVISVIQTQESMRELDKDYKQAAKVSKVNFERIGIV